MGRLYGAQVSVFNLLTHDNNSDSSAQAGVMNFARDVGVQGGVINLAENISYVQAGVVNMVKDVGHVQAGNVNIAGSVGHVQAGTLNIAGNVGNVQAGVVNIAGKVKRPVGIVNIAGYSEKTPIGLLNFLGNGILTMTFYGDEAYMTGAALNTGTAWFYTLLEYSQRPKPYFEWHSWPKTWGCGFGTRFGMRTPFYMNLDLTSFEAHNENPLKDIDWKDLDNLETQLREVRRHWFHNQGYKIRIGANYRLLPAAALTAGVSFNGVIEDKHGNTKMKPRNTGYWDVSYRDHNARIWPGYYAGLTIGRF